MYRLRSLFGFLVMVGFILWVGAAGAQDPAPAPPSGSDKVQRKQRLEQRLKEILEELDSLKESGEVPKEPTASVVKEQKATEEPGATPELALEDMSIISRREQKRPEGLTLSATPRSEHESQPTRHFRESLESIPGVVLRQANGPRDFNISIRGSGAKTGFGVRNIKMYEDGIIQIQSDGLARLDLHDPWFMQSVEVTRGACSSLYDNYCVGGMVHFKTRRGGEINGVETFFEGGSYGFQKYAVATGTQTKNLDIAFFSSYIAEDGFIDHTQYWTSTVNLNMRFRIDDRQTFMVKAINNDVDAKFATRLTQSQFNANARQMGGSGATNPSSLGQKRRDRRTIVGGLYENQIDNSTRLTMEADYDVKDINQPITDNINPNFKHYTDLRHEGSFLGTPLISTLGFFTNYIEQEGTTFANTNNGFGGRARATSNSRFTIRNTGARFREEWTFVPKWTAVLGFGYENSLLSGQLTNFSSTTGAGTTVGIDRTFDNFAPEAALTYRPNQDTKYWVRVATGYAIPTFGNLTVGSDGNPGSNFSLQPQKNLDIDVGTESWITKQFNLQLVGFWRFFRNEIITQGVPITTTTTGNFAVNAKESQYRGIEVAWKYLPESLPGFTWAGAYTHMENKYVSFVDQFNVGGVATQVVQNGHQVPSVEKNVFNSKATYNHAQSGFGGWVEGSWIDSFFVNNNNSLATPAYMLFNVNLNHNLAIKNNSYIRFVKTFFEVDNLFDKTYVASGTPQADSTADASKQAFFAGYGRSFYAGVTLGIF